MISISVVIAEFGFKVNLIPPSLRNGEGIILSILSKSERDKEFYRILRKRVAEKIQVNENFFVLLSITGRKPSEDNIHEEEFRKLFLFFKQKKNIPNRHKFSYERFLDVPNLEEDHEDFEKRTNSKLDFFKMLFSRQNEAFEALKNNKELYKNFCLDLIGFVSTFDDNIEKYKVFITKKFPEQLKKYISEIDSITGKPFLSKEQTLRYIESSIREVETLDDMKENFKKVPISSLKTKHDRIERLFPVRGKFLLLQNEDLTKYPKLYEFNIIALKKNIKLLEEYQDVVEKCLKFKEGYDYVISTRFEIYEFLSIMLTPANEYLLLNNNNNLEEETKGRVYDHLKYSLVIEHVERRKGVIDRIKSSVCKEGELRKKLRTHLHHLFKAQDQFYRIFFPDLKTLAFGDDYLPYFLDHLENNNINHVMSEENCSFPEIKKDIVHPMFLEESQSSKTVMIEKIILRPVLIKEEEFGKNNSTLSFISSSTLESPIIIDSKQHHQEVDNNSSIILELKNELKKVEEKKKEEIDRKEKMYKSILKKKLSLEGRLEKLEIEKREQQQQQQQDGEEKDKLILKHQKEMEVLKSRLLKKDENSNNNELSSSSSSKNWMGMVKPLVLQVTTLKKEKMEALKREEIYKSRKEELGLRISKLEESGRRMIAELERLRKHATELEFRNRRNVQEKEKLELENRDKDELNHELVEQMSRISSRVRMDNDELNKIKTKEFEEKNKALSSENSKLREKMLRDGDLEHMILLQGENEKMVKEIQILRKEMKEVGLSRDHHMSQYIQLKQRVEGNNQQQQYQRLIMNNNNRPSSSPPQMMNLHHPNSRPPPTNPNYTNNNNNNNSFHHPQNERKKIEELQKQNEEFFEENRRLKESIRNMESQSSSFSSSPSLMIRNLQQKLEEKNIAMETQVRNIQELENDKQALLKKITQLMLGRRR